MPATRVLFSIAGLHVESGGPARSVPELCRALALTDVAAEIVSLDLGPSGVWGPPQSAPLRVESVPCPGPLRRRLRWSGGFVGALRERCREFEPHLVHDTGLWLPTNHAAARLASALRLPRVVSPRGMLSPWALGHKAWRKQAAWLLYQRRELRAAHLLHATSGLEAGELRASGLRQPVAVIPNGVEVPQETQGEAFPAPAAGSRTVLFLSRIHPKKGLINLVEAWARVRPTGWRVVVAGDGDPGYLEAMRQAVRRAQLDAVFSFVGAVEDEDKWALYRSADLFVLPSHSENFGRVVAEALACGLPVISTRGTPWAGLVEHGCGFWVDVGSDPLALALREATALSDEARRDMGVRGRAWITKEFSWQSVAVRMRSVYEWILGRGPRPDCVEELGTPA